MAATATLSILGFLLLCVLVIAPAIVGLILIIKSRGRGPKFPSCGGCGYDVTGSVGSATRCPECGKDFLEVGIRPPGGRRSAAMLWSGILIMAIPVTCVGFGGVLSMISAQRMTQARQAATAAQAQAIAAQQAQANAMFPIPAPFSEEKIKLMTPEEASAAMAQVSAAMNRTDLPAADAVRLSREFNLLAARSLAPTSRPTSDR